ncbi:TAXI family TRAP transporter solute-binding subunit [Thermopetrobacter sp. TC1]|uniref:TAXI family TRAP transporter solute-binding subunit n=1 Tax=Thermopetrobacter sp. TC1 TaxID=1495045 RepID=UPI0018CD9A4C|nr:TAXI family TRAP transporter solute-binding subunit [Thermopetrobacter sp. TC1]
MTERRQEPAPAEPEDSVEEHERIEDTVNRRGLFLALIPLILSLMLAGGLYYYFHYVEGGPITVRIAADRTGSDVRELLEAVAKLAHKRDPDVNVVLIPSEDPAHNIQLLEDGAVDFAAIPSDAVTRPSFSLVANLYPDTYHLVVRTDSGIKSIYQLEGRRMAVPSYKTSAFRSFWFLIGQYGLNPEKMRPITLSQKDALRALRRGEVAGMFMMLPPGDRHIRWLAESTDIRILPIEQAEAMTKRRASLQVVEIPAGLYAGKPPLPETTIPSVAAQRMLVTRSDVDPDIVRLITAVLFENRRDLSIYSHLANLVTKPDLDGGTILPVHEGALAYYNRDQPSFLQENAEVIGVLFSIAAVMFSSLMWLRRRWLERQKGRVDVYNLDLVRIAEQARKTDDPDKLAALRQELYGLLQKVVHDLDEDKIEGEGFHYFSFTWEATLNAIREAEERLGITPSNCPPPMPQEAKAPAS